MKEKLVCIGNGMAGIRTIEELLKLAPDQHEITVFGSEPYGNYNRILLSPVLAGEKTIEDIILNEKEWYQENNITLYTNYTVTVINRGKREVKTDKGINVKYDRLLIATGSNPFIIPISGSELTGVVGFRDIQDVHNMLDMAGQGKNAVVIGGGILGLEAANGLMQQGMQVTVVHLLDNLMEQQLDKTAATLLQLSLEKRGLKFLMAAETTAILGERNVTGVRFKDGKEIPADLVVMAVGIRPSIKLAQQAGIYCERGIVVNDTLQTFDPRIYAVGECVQHRNQLYGLVAPLFEQAKVCANHLANLGYARYEGSVVSTKLKVTGIDLFSAGDFQVKEDSDELIFQDPSQGIYKKLVIENNRIKGAVLYGDTIDGSWYFGLMRDNVDISGQRDRLLFGQAHLGDSGHGKTAMAMSDDTEICGCNGVRKKDITDAIIKKNLFTLDDVRSHTKASSSCGSCTALVEQILSFTLGSEYTNSPKTKPLCACTEYTHADIQKVIKEQHLITIPAVMHFMDWKTPNGCHVCRPALNYYLICTWPEEAKDDSQSRFINERIHANIQKDGRYSIVPRIWGGITNPKELRALADIADKYNIPTVKFTGGQRIDLLGIEKQDLPAIWGELNQAGLVSGHAYGKALRTVKTCVGSEWCRFGTQDAISMGIKLEKLAWGSWTPHKFKLAVSGCPRNCSEATIKDFGVIAVDSGWELHVGGNGGIKVRVTDLLCKVTTQEEVLEYCGAFIQLYRETANYLERAAPWVERIGLTYIKEQVVQNATTREELNDRFLLSQKYAQKDPWQERATGGVDQHEFNFLPTEAV
ncbi:MAG: nitrite reductase large subunit NirB [Thiomargarita sp.]|nr:nitrite reductase large subunit NirB [Thiomargarita sp.]